MKQVLIWVGIDVSKKTLDVHIRPTREIFQVNNTSQGISTLIAKLQPLKPTRIILEATGGMELESALSLAEADLPVVVINPRFCQRLWTSHRQQAPKLMRLMQRPWHTLEKRFVLRCDRLRMKKLLHFKI